MTKMLYINSEKTQSLAGLVETIIFTQKRQFIVLNANDFNKK